MVPGSSGEVAHPVGGAQLRVGAHVLIQLGSELVTDVEQAILECVKNAYDADAKGCGIEVATQETGTLVEVGPVSRLARFDAAAESVQVEIVPLPPADERDGDEEPEDETPEPMCERRLSYTGRMTITDRGEGMTQDQLRSSWLVVSGSVKRGLPGQPKRKTTLQNRTPLGDKGLGRLGTMKIGDILLVETAKSTGDDIAVARFRWADCERSVTVDQIPVQFGSRPNAEGFKGTKVTVLGLKDLPEWRRPRRIDEITASLAKLVSPFEVTSTFPVSIQLDGRDRSLVSVTNEILDRAIAKFDFRWEADGQGDMELVATAYMRKRLIAGERSKQQREKTALVFGRDGGKGFRDLLLSPKKLKGYTRKDVSDTGPWYVELERRFPWSAMLMDNEGKIEDPGPFTGSFYYFHLQRQDEADKSAAAGIGISSDLIKGLTGIAVLRDGFRVRSPGDWLGLSAEMTSGSTYGLRTDNTIGYFALSGEFNAGLTEKSDREGFVEDAPYRGFLQIARQCRKFSSDAMDNVRRSLDEYARKLQETGREELARPGNPMRIVERSMQTARDARSLADKTVTDLRSDIEALEREVIDSGDAGRTAWRAVELAKTARDAVDAVRSKLDPQVEPADAVDFLRREISDKDAQVTALYESAAVGLSARGLAHELRTHLAEIQQRSKAIQDAARKSGNEAAMLPHLRSIRGSCGAIANAASLIDPMLPRSRTLRETFAVADFVREYVENRAISFEHAGIVAVVDEMPGAAIVRANRSRLLQVLDNLVRNSVYWLRRGGITGEGLPAKEVRIDVTDGGFIVSDTGPGVDPAVEERLFEIFVSGRPAAPEGQSPGGQGIGLFIVRQLLALDGCTVDLLDDLNHLGRRYRFEVDLTAVLAQPQ
ncbi:hypothetical protein BHAOGJBA_4555 [Methylobacterium hispanicum]|uniref:Histidine kinase domain-containing protein n=10 Tax=Pseudomonadota TaxID=1224 RepID=A0ABQ4STW5_9HYPH|nr:hypothetical protein BHAOGJBA_4555 [Methylobacterium hispanicum]GJE05671.1 hypothetical protein AOPFMNJM_0975 [Methylobacterium jeotgali]